MLKQKLIPLLLKFKIVINITNIIAMITLCACKLGKADVSASVPADTLTATVKI